MWSDNPVTVLGADVGDATCRREAGEAFAAFLQTEAAQRILPEYGFRPLDESVPLGDLFTEEYGVDPGRAGGDAAQARRRCGLGRDRPVDPDPQALVRARGDRHLGLDGRPDRRRPLEARRGDRGRAGDPRPLPLRPTKWACGPSRPRSSPRRARTSSVLRDVSTARLRPRVPGLLARRPPLRDATGHAAVRRRSRSPTTR